MGTEFYAEIGKEGTIKIPSSLREWIRETRVRVILKPVEENKRAIRISRRSRPWRIGSRYHHKVLRITHPFYLKLLELAKDKDIISVSSEQLEGWEENETKIEGIPLTIYLEQEDFSLLEKKTKETGQSPSKVIQMALREYFRNERKQLARRKILEMVKSRKKDEALLDAWREYERNERRNTRNFEELIYENGSR